MRKLSEPIITLGLNNYLTWPRLSWLDVYVLISNTVHIHIFYFLTLVSSAFLCLIHITLPKNQWWTKVRLLLLLPMETAFRPTGSQSIWLRPRPSLENIGWHFNMTFRMQVTRFFYERKFQSVMMREMIYASAKEPQWLLLPAMRFAIRRASWMYY